MQKKYQREQVSQSLTSEDYQKRISFQSQSSLVSIEVDGLSKMLKTGLASVSVSIILVVQLIDRNWFMHQPYDRWYRSIVDLVSFLDRDEADIENIKTAIKKHPPQNGWDEDSRQYVRLILKLAMKNKKEKTYARK